jgi:hypothetical protein
MTPTERSAARRQREQARRDRVARLLAALEMIATHPEAHMEGAGEEMQTIAREAIKSAKQD